MEAQHTPYLKHLYVCVNQREFGEDCCAQGQGEKIKEKLKIFVNENGLKGKVRVSSSGCMDLCAQGPNVMVYPGGRWYRKVTLADLDRIIEQELLPLVPDPRARSAAGPSIRAFLFDLGNVLVRFDHMQAAQAITRNGQGEAKQLFQILFDSPLITAHDEGRITTRQLHEHLKAEIGLAIEYDRFLEVWNGIFTENRQMSALVERLADRYPCYLISNTNRPHFEYCRDQYPVLRSMAGWILSYEVGVLKPHPAIYHRALELAQLPASEIFYVDDRSDLIEAAKQLGFQTHRFTTAEGLAVELKGLISGFAPSI